MSAVEAAARVIFTLLPRVSAEPGFIMKSVPGLLFIVSVEAAAETRVTLTLFDRLRLPICSVGTLVAVGVQLLAN